VSLCVSTLNTLKGPEPLFDDVTAKTRPTQRQQHTPPLSFRVTFWTTQKFCVVNRRCKFSTSKIASLAFWECRGRRFCSTIGTSRPTAAGVGSTRDRAFAPAIPIYSNTGAMKWVILHGEGGGLGGKVSSDAPQSSDNTVCVSLFLYWVPQSASGRPGSRSQCRRNSDSDSSDWFRRDLSGFQPFKKLPVSSCGVTIS
jgi:hypothetical protein